MKTTQELIDEAVERFSPIIYEPEHEEGQTCWCAPVTTVEGIVTHITHNPERDKLTKIFEKELTTLASQVEDAVLEREAKWCESQKHSGESLMIEAGSEYTTPKMYRALGNNSALQATADHLRSKTKEA